MLQPLSQIELQRYDWLDRASADPNLPEMARKLAHLIATNYSCERPDYCAFELTEAAAKLEIPANATRAALKALIKGDYLQPLAFGASLRDRSTYRLNWSLTEAKS